MKLIQKPMYRSLLAVVILLCFAITGVNAQELKCQLTVNAQKISGVDPSVFTRVQHIYTDNRIAGAGCLYRYYYSSIIAPGV
jgi:hypothetical protein